jgi:drug/metabolite transporter (DMT)-like permease
VLWGVLALAGFASATILIPRLVPADLDPLVGATLQSLAALCVILPWALLDGGLAVPLDHAALGSGAWLALVNGVGSPLLITALVQRRGATAASSLLFLVPPVTAVAAWPVLGEPIGPGVLVGLVVSAVGVLLVRRPATVRTKATMDASCPTPSTMGA